MGKSACRFGKSLVAFSGFFLLVTNLLSALVTAHGAVVQPGPIHGLQQANGEQTDDSQLPMLFLEPPIVGEIAAPVAASLSQQFTAQPAPVGLLRQRVVTLNGQLLAAVRSGGADGIPEPADAVRIFRLNLFADMDEVVYLHHLERTSAVSALQRELWIGEIVDTAFSSALFIVRGGSVTANIRTPQGLFTIRPLPDAAAGGLHLIREIDAAQFSYAVDDGRSLPMDATVATPVRSAMESDGVQEIQNTVDDGSVDDGTVIDLMVAYSAAARSAVGGTEAMLDRIALAVAEANRAYANSGINPQLRLVHAQETSYNTTGDIGTDLERLTATNDGSMDGLHALRDTYSADLVSLWVEGANHCGIGWINSTADYAFSVVDRWCAENTVTVAHELGHNFGARHDWYVDDHIDAPPYNKGHVDLTGRWITVMSYFNKCMDAGLSCRQILHFSNPNIPYGSRATGVPQGTSTACVRYNLNNPVCDAENYRIHNDRAVVVANFRLNHAVADLTVSKIDLADPVTAGDEISYQITVRNVGERAAADVQLMDTLPQGVVFIRTSWPNHCTHAGGIVRCAFGTMNSNAAVRVDLTVQTNSATPSRVFNTARVTTTTVERDTANNSDSEGTTVQPLPAATEDLLFVSSTSNGKIGSIAFGDEDILAFERSTGKWVLVFDGSDVGVTADVNGFEWLPDGSLLLTLMSQTVLPGLGVVDDSDIVRFIPQQLGATTAGTFVWYLDGSDVGLTTGAEDIDAIAISPAGHLVISTLGSARVDEWVTADADLLEFRANRLGEATDGTWHLYLDGSDVALDNKSEDLFATWIDRDNGNLYLSTHGTFAVDGITGSGSDIFFCRPLQLGETSRCQFTNFWRGADYQFGREAIDGVALGDMPFMFRVDLAAQQEDTVITDAVAASAQDNTDDTESDNRAADLEALEDADANLRIFLPLIRR